MQLLSLQVSCNNAKAICILTMENKMQILSVIQNLEFVSGTCLQGEYKTNYETLVEVFGQPTEIDLDGKIDAHWSLDFLTTEGRETVTVYNWKTDGVPFGEYDWHIGGHTKNAVDLFVQYMENATTTKDLQ